MCGITLPAFFDDYYVADTNVFALDFIGVVQAGPADNRAGQFDGPKDRPRA